MSSSIIELYGWLLSVRGTSTVHSLHRSSGTQHDRSYVVCERAEPYDRSCYLRSDLGRGSPWTDDVDGDGAATQRDSSRALGRRTESPDDPRRCRSSRHGRGSRPALD